MNGREIRVPEAHRKSAIQHHFKFAVITISTSKAARVRDRGDARPAEINDVSGETAIKLLTERGHDLVLYDVLPDDADGIRAAVKHAIDSDADVIITTGGTGLSKNDVTIEAISSMIEKEMTGFGEIFRLKSYEKIGNAAILSRSIAGIIQDKVIFCLPGSPDAVELAMKEIILDELPHIMKHVRGN